MDYACSCGLAVWRITESGGCERVGDKGNRHVHVQGMFGLGHEPCNSSTNSERRDLLKAAETCGGATRYNFFLLLGE